MAEEQCDERYGAPGPRDEPFEVTYRCGKFRGHAGGHGPADPPLGSKADKPIREQSAMELLETHAKALEQENARLARGAGSNS